MAEKVEPGMGVREGPLTPMEFILEKVGREPRADRDEVLIRSLTRWPDYERLLARLVKDMQAAMDKAAEAADAGNALALARWAGYADCAKAWLAWMTRYPSGSAERTAVATASLQKESD